MTDIRIAAPERFAPLPNRTGPDGTPRRIGVEVEFAGLDEAETARLAATFLGGTAQRAEGDDWKVRGTRIGDLDIYLDIALRKSLSGPLRDLGMRLGREVLPVEIVTQPLTLEQLADLSTFLTTLRERGALGSEASAFYGFGVHFNPSIAGPDHVVRPLLAYALLEPWMRRALPIEMTRQALPFTDRYPEKLVRHLVELGPEASLPDVIRAYREATLSRNHGLDMLPVFVKLHPEIIAASDGKGGTVNPRPAFHFRLPDCRISDPQWSLDYEWRRWWLVEQVASKEAVLRQLCRDWPAEHSGMNFLGLGWPEHVGRILRDADLIG
ncbi:amidoligase family protein [Thioclava sp. GXIMD4216]|uniref:amidoligase family protein n=1 Tax=Thioclava sp. GXIMD4216 TaxID=3131929 RepID=UPI0030CFF09D